MNLAYIDTCRFLYLVRVESRLSSMDSEADALAFERSEVC